MIYSQQTQMDFLLFILLRWDSRDRGVRVVRMDSVTYIRIKIRIVEVFASFVVAGWTDSANISATKPEIGRRWNCGVISRRRLASSDSSSPTAALRSFFLFHHFLASPMYLHRAVRGYDSLPTSVASALIICSII